MHSKHIYSVYTFDHLSLIVWNINVHLLDPPPILGVIELEKLRFNKIQWSLTRKKAWNRQTIDILTNIFATELIYFILFEKFLPFYTVMKQPYTSTELQVRIGTIILDRYWYFYTYNPLP
jgi:hypothetical protein